MFLSDLRGDDSDDSLVNKVHDVWRSRIRSDGSVRIPIVKHFRRWALMGLIASIAPMIGIAVLELRSRDIFDGFQASEDNGLWRMNYVIARSWKGELTLAVCRQASANTNQIPNTGMSRIPAGFTWASTNIGDYPDDFAFDRERRHPLGFQLVTADLMYGGVFAREYSCTIPDNFLFVCDAAFGLCMWRLWRRRIVSGKSKCAVCGYDLRASPDRCPECGTELTICK